MKRLERLAAALTPKRWPVRWRLAAVSAVLTFLILVIFALVVGRLTPNRLHTDFNQDVQSTAVTAAENTHLQFDVLGQLHQTLNNVTLPDHTASVHLVQADGTVMGSNPPNAPSFGPPNTRSVRMVGDLAVAAAPLSDTRFGPLF